MTWASLAPSICFCFYNFQTRLQHSTSMQINWNALLFALLFRNMLVMWHRSLQNDGFGANSWIWVIVFVICLSSVCGILCNISNLYTPLLTTMSSMTIGLTINFYTSMHLAHNKLSKPKFEVIKHYLHSQGHNETVCILHRDTGKQFKMISCLDEGSNICNKFFLF